MAKAKKAPEKKTVQKSATKTVSIKVEWIFMGILGFLLIVSIFTRGFSSLPMGLKLPFLDKVAGASIVDKDKVKEDVLAYINGEVLQGQSTAEILNIEDDPDSDLYKIKLNVGGQEYESYVSKDGKYLYIDRMEVVVPENTDDATATTTGTYTKQEKPKVLMFTMSYCPYGNQAEDMISPVHNLLGNSVDIEPHYVIYSDYAKNAGASWDKYCSSQDEKYCSMHGVQELNQNVRELCAYKYQQDKFWDFVMTANSDCTSQNVDSCWEGAAQKVGLDVNKIKSCQQDEAVALLEYEVSLNEKYSVTGSPTVLINETKYNGSRTAEAFKNALCSAFTNVPDSCSQTLDDSAATASGSCN